MPSRWLARTGGVLMSNDALRDAIVTYLSTGYPHLRTTNMVGAALFDGTFDSHRSEYRRVLNALKTLHEEGLVGDWGSAYDGHTWWLKARVI